MKNHKQANTCKLRGYRERLGVSGDHDKLVNSFKCPNISHMT